MSTEDPIQREQGTRTVTLRKCPYCDDTVQSRGLYAHVMNSQDEAHGEYRSVPSGFNPREAEIVGEEEVSSDRKTPSESLKRLYLCTLCGAMLKGEMGYKVHLAKVAGDDVHPQDIDVSDGYYSKIPANADWEPTIPEEQIREIEKVEMQEPPSAPESDSLSAKTKRKAKEKNVPLAALRDLVSRFDGKGDAYDDAEKEVEELIEAYSD